MGLKRRAAKAQNWLFAQRRSRQLEQLHRAPSLTVGNPTALADVSLTSYGARLESVHLTILSILDGSEAPRTVTLWVDPGTLDVALPPRLAELQGRGLRVQECARRIGPHAKYYPHVSANAPHKHPLVTADDDVLYPTDWLQGLADAHRRSPGIVHCYRAHTFSFDEQGSPLPYNSWPPCTTNAATFTSFATGVSGVIYPPRFLDRLEALGDSFMSVTPRADDVWLHAQAVGDGVRVQQLGSRPRAFPTLPNTQRHALHRTNTAQAGNDGQIRATYSASMLMRITEDSAAARSNNTNPGSAN